MSNGGNTYDARVTSLGNSNLSSAPFALWTLPNPLDGHSYAPCYGPYGESSPPVISLETSPLLPAANIIKTDTLRSWERGAKFGKKANRTKKSKLNQGGGWDGQGYVSSDGSMTGNSSSNSSSNSGSSSGFGSNTSSAATTPTEISPQSSHATYDSQVPSTANPYVVDAHDPGIVFAQPYHMCPSTVYKDLRHELLNRQTFVAAINAVNIRRPRPPCAPTTAQAAIAEQRSMCFGAENSPEEMFRADGDTKEETSTTSVPKTP